MMILTASAALDATDQNDRGTRRQPFTWALDCQPGSPDWRRITIPACRG